MLPDYKAVRRTKWRSNARELQRLVSSNRIDGNLHRKIDNFCERFDVEKEQVIKEIKASTVVAAFFAKDPSKQNIYEKAAAEYIGRMSGVADFQNLPTNKLVISNGAVMEKRQLVEIGGASTAKTIDFEWKYEGKTFYASHKYTENSGGAQGSAYKDLQDFISEAVRTTARNTHFVAIADGGFYRTMDGQARSTRIKRLKDLASSKAVHACRIEELESLMKNIVKK